MSVCQIKVPLYGVIDYIRCDKIFFISFSLDSTEEGIYYNDMDILVDKLENDMRNPYEVAYAMTRRAYQITKLNEVRPPGSAVVPIPAAINQVLTDEVRYQLEEK